VKRYAERPGEFFQSVDLDDHAVFADGKFHGFRLLALRDGLERSGLRAGDVVTSVNKMPIERPEQAIAVFRSLEKAKELRVDYERNGEPKTVTVPIIDDAGQAAVPALVPSAPVPPIPPAAPTK
jgi:type II secretory pathway component PulC